MHSTRSSGSPTTRSAGLGDSPGYDHHTHMGETSNGKPVALTCDKRLRHMAIFGSTGVGKTTFLLNIVGQDIARGDRPLVIDPHGDFAEKALSLVPPSRNNQVCYVDLTDSALP